MRFSALLHSNELIPSTPDTVARALLGANAGAAFDIPAGAGIMRLTGMTTGGAGYNFMLLMGSTKAAIPSTNSSAITSSAGSSDLTCVFNAQFPFFQIPGGTTGFSLVAPTSGIVTAEFWGPR